MKNKLVVSIISLFVVLTVKAQLISGTLIQGSAPNSVIFALKSSAAFSNQFSNVQFVLQIPNTVLPIPSVKIKNNILSTYIPTYNFNEVTSATPLAFSNEGGYYNYLFSSVIVGGPVFNFTTTDFNVLEVEVNGAPLVTATVRFAQLPNGGLFGQHNFYVETNTGDHTNELNMFYGNGNMNAIPPDPLGYAGYSYVPFPNVVLPIKWLSFTAVKQGNNGQLNWAVTNEDDNHHYELQRSINGTDFTPVTTVNKSATNGGVYNYTDIGITGFNSSIVFYRVKQVEINGNFSYSDIRHLIIDKKGPEITIFPNPVVKGFYVNVPLTGAATEKVTLNLFGTNGQIMISKEITAAQAASYYFDITDKKMAAGQYNLQIIMNEKTIATKMLTIKQ